MYTMVPAGTNLWLQGCASCLGASTDDLVVFIHHWGGGAVLRLHVGPAALDDWLSLDFDTGRANLCSGPA